MAITLGVGAFMCIATDAITLQPLFAADEWRHVWYLAFLVISWFSSAVTDHVIQTMEFARQVLLSTAVASFT